MTFEQADRLYHLICKAYEVRGCPVNSVRDNIIITALALGQFVINIRKGSVVWFAAYWRLTAENAERVQQEMEPTSVLHGEHIYIAEAVNNGSMREFTTAIRKEVGTRWASWHRPQRKDKFNKYGRGWL